MFLDLEQTKEPESTQLPTKMGTDICTKILELYKKSMYKMEELVRVVVDDTLGKPHRREI